MIIISRPSVSPYLCRTLFELGTPVILSEEQTVPMKPALKLLAPDALLKNPRAAYQSLVLTSSENALSFLYQAIPHDDRILKAKIFKDKTHFRRALAQRFPDFFFREFSFAELDKVDPATLKFPLVLKPSVGISSIGVRRVGSEKEWGEAVEFLKSELLTYSKNYSDNVVEDGHIIAEQWIEGTELAIDGYYTSNAEPVILNILEHLFLNNLDTSDRMYYTRRSLVRKFYEPLQRFLREFGDAFDLKRFPFHLEVRYTPDGKFVPIELNPLRFSGLGTTEIAEYAYGINVYKKFFEEKEPDWKTILSSPDDSVYAFMCADLSTEVFERKNAQINDRAFLKCFTEVLEYRMLSETETSTFAVIFFREEDLSRAEYFLKMDFDQFVLPQTARAPSPKVEKPDLPPPFKTLK
jgi:predicted ATP-grasp superfamily ATP-dependent carboligase